MQTYVSEYLVIFPATTTRKDKVVDILSDAMTEKGPRGEVAFLQPHQTLMLVPELSQSDLPRKPS